MEELKQALLLGYAAFAGARNTLVARLFIVGMVGVLTIAGLSWIQKHEAQTPIAEWMR